MAKIVAITSCIAGIAHTYMASASLKKGAKACGDTIKVETQGAMGIEDKLAPDDIKEADVVIFAVDTTVEEKERFDGKKILKVGTSPTIKDGVGVIKKAEALLDN